MRRTIGPLQLLSGLQLLPAEGDANGLYRALNVEPRDGFMQPRRGQRLRSAIVSQSSNNGDATMVQTPLVTIGASVFYVGFDGLPTPDTFIQFRHAAAVGGDACEDGVTVAFYGADNAWHTVDVVMSTGGGFRIPDTAEGALFWLWLVVPFGWQKAQPAGTTANLYWLRFTRNTGTYTRNASFAKFFSVGATAEQFSAEICDCQVLAPVTRTNKGPYILTRVAGLGTKLADSAAWEVVDLAKVPTFPPLIQSLSDCVLNAYYDAAPARYYPSPSTDVCCGVYIPASDHLLVSLGAKKFDIDCAAGTAVEFVPDPQDDPEVDPYADIGVETEIPTMIRTMVMFSGRVFALGADGDPHRVQWSAPGAFWTVWPSANLARIDGGGLIQGAGVIDQSMFIFTSSGIWRAALGDPTDGNESDLFLAQVEETPCTSRRSVVVANKLIVFLAPDGVRVFDGVRSRLVSNGVRDLFRPDSENVMACMRPEVATGYWHPLENQYRLSYPTPAAQHSDTTLVVDLDDKTCWLSGADVESSMESGVVNPDLGVIAQRSQGMRVAAAGWDPYRRQLLALLPENIIAYLDEGPTDLGAAMPWYAESQTLRIAAAEKSIVEQVVVSAARDHFQPMKLSVIPDGDRARADVRSPTVQTDQLDTTAAVGSTSLAGSETLLRLDGSIAPYQARFRKAGRNHRIRMEGSPPTYDPVRMVSLTVGMVSDERHR